MDVIFIGNSKIEYGVSPVSLYEETGICSYSLASSGQPIDFSYWLLKDAFSKQKPSIVVLLASNLFEYGSDANVRRWHILDNYNLSLFKIEMARSYAKGNNSDGFLPAIFPIIKYHTRWNELTEDDFSFEYGGEYYSLGQWITGAVGPTIIEYEEIDKQLEILKEDSFIKEAVDGKQEIRNIESSYIDPFISEFNMQSFLGIKNLCDENNAELLLVQIPSGVYPQYGNAWTKEQSDTVKGLAKTSGVNFYDLQYDTNIGLDWNSDSCDGGIHLNIKGAQKVSKALGVYLQNTYNLKRKNSDQYEAYCTKFNKVKDVALIQAEKDLTKYIEMLNNNSEKWTILIAASDEYTTGMEEEQYNQFEKLGLTLIKEGQYRDSYAAIINDSKVEYEAVSKSMIEHKRALYDHIIDLRSSGWNVSSNCSIKVDTVEYSYGKRGLNFVIIDTDSDTIIDSVVFDTFDPKCTAYRDYSITMPFN